MARGQQPKAEAPPRSTAQQLDAIVKSARNKLRKDKGLDGDMDRLPLLAWLMFLKLLDDVERVRRAEDAMQGRPFRPVVEPPYRWRDWATPKDTLTGDDLLRFLTAEADVLRPDGTKGPGLFATLRSLRAEGVRDRRSVVATVFEGVVLKARSGHILREVVELVDSIHFDASDEVFQLSRLYEGMLRQLRDAAGTAGEYYTPRPVVRFMVKALDPRLGEVVEDPACGTAGFLVEAFAHLREQRRSAEDERTLQERSIRGGEAKPLPFLLGQMNLLLHGLDAPDIDPGNALRRKLTEIGEAQRVDVILTNPPFGGEEETSVLDNFPSDKRTAETALLFLQLIMRKLRRGGRGRAAVVVPNGTLSDRGIAARIKAELLEACDLRAVIRLPEGVFAPYTDIPANILFFSTGDSTREIAYWEQQLSEGRRKYTKTQPMLDEELDDVLAWYRAGFPEDDRAWRVKVDGLVVKDETGRVIGCNLDLKNPKALAKEDHRAPAEIIAAAIEKQREAMRSAEDMQMQTVLQRITSCRRVRLGEILTLRPTDTEVASSEMYQFAGVYSFGRGVFRSVARMGSETAYRRLTRLRQGNFVYPKLMAWEGAFGVVPADCDGCFVSPEFPVFEVNTDAVIPELLELHFRNPANWPKSTGTNVRRKRVHPTDFLRLDMPLPPPAQQHALVETWQKAQVALAAQREAAAELQKLLSALLHEAFGEDTAALPRAAA